MNKPVVSIIVPVYNTEKYLEECIDTVLGQSLSQLELVCVDDGSTDRSREILDVYATKDSRVKVLSQQNKYAGVARNYGFTKAEGEYVIFLDSDDFFENYMLEKLYDKAKEFDADICVCDAKNYDEASGRFGEPKSYLDKEKIPKNETFSYKTNPNYIFNFTSPAPWNMLYKKSFIIKENLKFQEIKRANDLRFFGMALIKASSIITVNERLLTYRIRKSGNLQSNNSENPLEFYSALVQIREEIYKMGIMKSVEKSFMNFALSTFMYQMKCMTTYDSFKILYDKFFNEGIKLFFIDKYKETDIYSDVVIKRFRRYNTETVERLAKDIEVENLGNNVQFYYRNKTKNPKISVIIPVCNTSNYLEKCINSVREQTFRDFEIICINDGSNDDSLKKLIQIADSDERITLVSNTNQGVSKTRNMGMDIAKGIYILFLDSDDYLEKNTLEILYYKTYKEDLDILFFNMQADPYEKAMEKEAEKFSRYYTRKKTYEGIMPGIDLYAKMNRAKEYRVNVGMQFFKNSFLKYYSLRFFENILYEDNLFTFQAILQANRVGYIKNKLNNKIVRPNSIMTSPAKTKNFMGYFICYAEMLKFSLLFENNRAVSDEIKGLFQQNITTVYNSAIRIYRKLSEEEIKSITFDRHSLSEILYSNLKEAELKIRVIRKSKTFKTGKIILYIPSKIKKIFKRVAEGKKNV